MYQGGDLTEIRYSNPLVGDGTFFCKSAEDVNYDRGGFRVNDDANGVAGNGAGIYQKNRVRWMVEATIAWDQAVQQELDKLTDLAEALEETEWTFVHSNGTIDRATGFIIGDVQGNANTATAAFKAGGGGKLENIAT